MMFRLRALRWHNLIYILGYLVIFSNCWSVVAKEFLPPEKAFTISAELQQDGLKVYFDSVKDYYLYQESITVQIDHKKLSPVEVAKPHEKFDDNFNKIVKTYKGKVAYLFHIKDLPPGAPIELQVVVQGCADQGICYPPMSRIIRIAQYGKEIYSIDPATPEGLDTMKVSLDQTSWWQVKDDSNALSTFLENTSISLLLLAFFILGVGLAFTPCMLPMLPILSSIIFGTTEHHLLSRRKTVTLAISYILGMAFAFSLAGMATAWFGAGFAAILQNQWVLLSFTIFMLFLAGSLFGFYELKISSSWQSMINRWMGKHQGGSFAGVFILGGLSSLIASPCITAPLAGVLTFIAKSGEVQQGGMILFVMACGMGLPLLLFAIGASRIVPRVGPWMIRVQRFFGIALVILAAWIVSPVINSWIMPSQKSPDGTKIIAQLPYRVVSNEKDLKQLLDGAKNEQKPALITFYADWCVSCKELELRTLADQRVKERLTRYERIEVDLSILGEDQKDLLRNYGLFGPPAIIILDDRGIEKKSARSVGFISAERLRELL